MVASSILLNPKLAARTLLELSSFSQHHKLPVLLVQLGDILVFRTAHAGVELALASETIVFRADTAPVVCEGSVEHKYGAATGSRAPAGVCHVVIDVVVEGKISVLLSKLSRQIFVDLC